MSSKFPSVQLSNTELLLNPEKGKVRREPQSIEYAVFWGPERGKMGSALALHATDLDSNPDIPYGTLRPAKE